MTHQGKALEEFLYNKKISVDEPANLLGYSRQNVYYYIGREKLSITVLKKLKEILGFVIDEQQDSSSPTVTSERVQSGEKIEVSKAVMRIIQARNAVNSEFDRMIIDIINGGEGEEKKQATYTMPPEETWPNRVAKNNNPFSEQKKPSSSQ